MPLPHPNPLVDPSDETVIRDSLYDRVPLTGPIRRLLETPAFLRLDGIQQLGFVSRVWPGARHTRFEHSLGVMHLARLAVTHLRQTPGGAWITADDAATIVAAALLHDIGHYPFSHAIEELGHPIRSHEDVGAGIILQGEVAATLADDWGVDPARVAALVNRETSGHAADDVLRGLLSGTLDVDKLDYLPRDARACNVPYGGVDTDRLIASLRVLTLANGSRRIGVTDKGVSALHSLINARQEMFDNVYWHHANRAMMVMLLRAIQDALVAGCIGPASLTNHDDASLLAFVRDASMPESTRRLADALATRRIHKRAVEFSARAGAPYAALSALWYDAAKRREVERRICDALGAPETAVLIDIPKPETWTTDVVVEYDQPPVGMERQMTWRAVVGLDEVDLKRYEEHRRMIRIVTDDTVRETVAARWDSLLDL